MHHNCENILVRRHIVSCFMPLDRKLCQFNPSNWIH